MNSKISNIKIFFVFLILIFSGCSLGNSSRINDEKISINANEIYNQGIKNLEGKNYKRAIENFESVKSIYPYSNYAKNSLEKLVEIHSKQKNYDDAILDLEELMINYRDNVNYEEVRYYHAILNYTKLQKQLRDQKLIGKTSDVLAAFIEDFPNSNHMQEIKEKLSITNGRLIYREMEIGYFYELQRNYVASLKRYLLAYLFSKNNRYRDEILYRIYYCYHIIGLDGEGKKYFDELKNEFPNSRWLLDAERIEKS